MTSIPARLGQAPRRHPERKVHSIGRSAEADVQNRTHMAHRWSIAHTERTGVGNI